MTNDLMILLGLAASIGFFHTLAGPDHYLPFIFMAKARNWSITKTSWITVACGIGHVGSSIILGTFGLALGITLSKLEYFEGFRGNLAAWAFVIFGGIYFIWGVYRAIINKPHKHIHFHKDGTIHDHDHQHGDEHGHVHNKNITPWILFTIFVLGPCEAFIPMLLFPAAQGSTFGVIMVSLVFGIVTVATMLGIVLLATYGFNFVKLGRLERYVHALSGAIILLSGIAIIFGL
jgi:ABC-type nickel/cobalt efflux system permease component RcnA